MRSTKQAASHLYLQPVGKSPSKAEIQECRNIRKAARKVIRAEGGVVGSWAGAGVSWKAAYKKSKTGSLWPRIVESAAKRHMPEWAVIMPGIITAFKKLGKNYAT